MGVYYVVYSVYMLPKCNSILTSKLALACIHGHQNYGVAITVLETQLGVHATTVGEQQEHKRQVID